MGDIARTDEQTIRSAINKGFPPSPRQGRRDELAIRDESLAALARLVEETRRRLQEVEHPFDADEMRAANERWQAAEAEVTKLQAELEEYHSLTYHDIRDAEREVSRLQGERDEANRTIVALQHLRRMDTHRMFDEVAKACGYTDRGWKECLAKVAAGAAAEQEAEAVRWYVHCGCAYHGDHLGCDESCKFYGGGCQHRLGEEVTALTEAEADSHEHGPDCYEN